MKQYKTALCGALLTASLLGSGLLGLRCCKK